MDAQYTTELGAEHANHSQKANCALKIKYDKYGKPYCALVARPLGLCNGDEALIRYTSNGTALNKTLGLNDDGTEMQKKLKMLLAMKPGLKKADSKHTTYTEVEYTAGRALEALIANMPELQKCELYVQHGVSDSPAPFDEDTVRCADMILWTKRTSDTGNKRKHHGLMRNDGGGGGGHHPGNNKRSRQSKWSFQFEWMDQGGLSVLFKAATAVTEFDLSLWIIGTKKRAVYKRFTSRHGSTLEGNVVFTARQMRDIRGLRVKAIAQIPQVRDAEMPEQLRSSHICDVPTM
jgi:hypothetical protein